MRELCGDGHASPLKLEVRSPLQKSVGLLCQPMRSFPRLDLCIMSNVNPLPLSIPTQHRDHLHHPFQNSFVGQLMSGQGQSTPVLSTDFVSQGILMHACVLQAWRYSGGHSVLLGSASTTVQALEDAPQTHLQLSGGKVRQHETHGPVSNRRLLDS